MVLTNGCDLCICVWNERYKKEGGIQRTEDGVMISTFILRQSSKKQKIIYLHVQLLSYVQMCTYTA